MYIDNILIYYLYFGVGMGGFMMIVLKGIGNPLLTFFTNHYTLSDYQGSFHWDGAKTKAYLTSIMENFHSDPMTDYTLGYVFLNDQRISDGCHRVTILFFLLQHLYQVAVQHHWDWSRQIAPLITNHEESFHQYLHNSASMHLQPYSSRHETFPLISDIANPPIFDLHPLIAKVIDDHLAKSDYPSFTQWILHHGILTVV